MTKKRGGQSIVFVDPPTVSSVANVAGPMEGQGALQGYFDKIMNDTLYGMNSWEQCESYMLEWAIREALKKANSTPEQLDCIFAGDLLNQLMSTHFAVRNFHRPFLGLYGACSTMAQSLLVGSVFLDGGFGHKVAVAASSHHNAAERQYRFPTELGVQPPPISQWTVTGAGAAILSSSGAGPRVTAATIGTIVDMGIKDTNAMGPAMAPAAADTIWNHFRDTGREPGFYDMIFTGDLGSIGKRLVNELLQEKGLDISNNYEDCGCMVYHEHQDVHAGASGCASSAVVLCGYIYHRMMKKEWLNILFIGTGSLHSTTSYQQQESIPCIAHAVSLAI